MAQSHSRAMHYAYVVTGYIVNQCVLKTISESAIKYKLPLLSGLTQTFQINVGCAARGCTDFPRAAILNFLSLYSHRPNPLL